MSLTTGLQSTEMECGLVKKLVDPRINMISILHLTQWLKNHQIINVNLGHLHSVEEEP